MTTLVPLSSVRWLVKKDGTRVLQQRFAQGSKNVWLDVPEEKEGDA